MKPTDTGTTDTMKKEYDFTDVSGVRGKYYKAYRKGHNVSVHNENGTATVQYFTQEDGAVMLEPDVAKAFPTQEAVNHALRLVMQLTGIAKPLKTKTQPLAPKKRAAQAA